MAALDALPGAVGVNNHQGSRATADRRVMDTILGVVRERGLLFLDSRTTAETLAAAEAKRFGVPVLSRDVFLDDRATEEKAEGGTAEALGVAWARAKGIAIRRGTCVVIGHPHPSTLDFLARELPAARREGFTLASRQG